MILTLTPNPSIDRTVALAERLVRGAVHRVETEISQAGGKGVNISRAAVAAGLPTVAVLPAAPDDPFVLELVAAGVDCQPEPPTGEVRVNLTITEPDGTTTKLNAPGSVATSASLAALQDGLLQHAEAASWVVLAGSLPPGAPVDWYADLVRALRRTHVRIALDTSDAPLAAVVAGLPDAAPDLMKPNAEELASFTGQDAALLESDPEAAAAAAATLVDQGVGAVLATLGGHGAVLVTAEGAWHAVAPATIVVSTVGAGDSSLFGYLLGDVRGGSPIERLALGVAYGSAAVGLAGTTVPNPSQTHPDLVEVRPLNLPSGVAP